MHIELISIGDELLRGSTVNTNATFIARHLEQAGYALARQMTLPDEEVALRVGLREALDRADVVVTTGGLGPTLDDKTRTVAAELFRSEWRFDEELAADLKRRFGEDPVWLQDQATVPVKAKCLRNPIGTAPGLVFEEGGKVLILLPGVPMEMQRLFVEQVVPWIKERFAGQKKYTREIFFSILHESLVDPELRRLQREYAEVEVGIYPDWGRLSVLLRGMRHEAVDGFANELEHAFAPYVFGAPGGKIEEAVQAWFVERGYTLACAESCTGGALAAQVTSVAGASEYFLGSYVTYSNEQKRSMLHVSEDTLAAHGAVSAEVVIEMLRGVFIQSAADFGIAVVGVAGPTGGSDAKPVGTIFAAISKRGEKPDVGTFRAKGDRQAIILSTSTRLLGALYRKVTKGIPAFPLYC